MTQTNSRRLVQLMIACVIFAAMTITGATPALAAPAAPTPDAGWLRVAHFSPDTKPVDVRLTQLGHDTAIVELDSVPYGAVSAYWSLRPGIYLVTMTRAGARATSTPVARLSVTVVEGQSTTVAAYGRNSHLTMKAFADDLATPAPGTARIRLLQASTTSPTVTVATSTGKTIADRARGGTATPYVDVPAGPWTLMVHARTSDLHTTVSLVPGSVTTVVVIDTARGGITARPIVDSAAAEQIPVGAVQTGGGFLARNSAPNAEIPRNSPSRRSAAPEVLR